MSGGRKIFVDLETRSPIDLKKTGVDVYAKCEKTEIVVVGIAIDNGPVEILPPTELQNLFNTLNPLDRIIAHNARFEISILTHVGGKYTIACPPPHMWECTMVMSYAMGLPGSLEGACAAVGIKDAKDLVGQRIMMQLTKPKKDGSYYEESEYPDKYERLKSYCKKDVEAERTLYARLRKLSKFETAVWQLDYEINERGIGVDTEAARVASEIAGLKKQKLDYEIDKLTNGYVPVCTASAALLDWLKMRGVEVASVDKSSLLTLLNDKNLDETVRKVLNLRKEAAKSSNAKLSKMLDSASPDGRIRGTLQYHASHTGRWGGRKIQPQNFPRGKLSELEVEMFFGILGGK